MKKVIVIILFFNTCLLFSQNSNYSSLVQKELINNSNALVKLDECQINILDFDKVNVIKKRIVTVFNSKGNRHVKALVFYDKSKTIKGLNAKIFDVRGNQIKKFKAKDFKDISAADGVSIYTDDRVKYLDYKPVNYPYTVEFELEYNTSFTVNLPSWQPLSGYSLSVENSKYVINNFSDSVVRIQETNFENFSVEKGEGYNYVLKNTPAIKYEDYAPSIYEITPSVKAVLETFNMKGVSGINKDWSSFGKWMYDNLLSDVNALPVEVIDEVKQLIKHSDNNLDKARIIYDYVQLRSRYISVQVGIGGWKPSLAKDVHRLGYGDCKGLSNYTKALLDALGVPSYYTIIYGGKFKRDINENFSSLQGNHVILTMLNDKSEYVTLECTSQTTPFGYGANFTDGRKALIVTPDGGEIITTKTYKTTENKLTTKANIVITSENNIKAQVAIQSEGSQYSRSDKIDYNDLDEQKLFYKNYWDDINHLNVKSVSLSNDKEAIRFTEKVLLEINNYLSNITGGYLFTLNMFNKLTEVPARYTTRELPFEIDSGFVDEDEYTITIPDNYELEGLLHPVEIKNKFGLYRITLDDMGGNTLLYKRSLQIESGQYSKEDYSNFRAFLTAVVKHDKSKIAIKHK